MVTVVLIGGMNKSFFPFSIHNCRFMIDMNGKTMLDSAIDNLCLREESEKIYLVASDRYKAQIDSYLRLSSYPYEVFYDDGERDSGGALKNFVRRTSLEDDRMFVMFDNFYLDGLSYDFSKDDPITAYRVSPNADFLFLIDTDFLKYSSDDKSFSMAEMLSIYSNFGEYRKVDLKPDYYMKLDDSENINRLKRKILEKQR